MCRRALPVVPAEGDLGFHAATAPDTKMQTTTPVSCCRMHLIPVHSKTLTADAPPAVGMHSSLLHSVRSRHALRSWYNPSCPQAGGSGRPQSSNFSSPSASACHSKQHASGGRFPTRAAQLLHAPAAEAGALLHDGAGQWMGTLDTACHPACPGRSCCPAALSSPVWAGTSWVVADACSCCHSSLQRIVSREACQGHHACRC